MGLEIMKDRNIQSISFPITMLAADEGQATEFREILTENRYEQVQIVFDQGHLLQSVQRQNSRLVIIDLDYAGTGSGIEAAEKLAETLEVPKIYIGGDIAGQDIQRIRQTLPWAIFTRPVGGLELITVIDNIARKSGEMECTVDRQICPIAEKSVLGHQSLDQEGNLVYVNRRWLEMTGYSHADQVIGRNFSEFIIEDDIPVFRKRFPKFKKRGEVINAPFTLKQKDGGTVRVSVNGKVVNNSSGKFLRTHCLLNDVTVLERQKSELEESLHNLEEAERIGKIGSWIYDPETKKSKWSKMMFRMHGLSPETDQVPEGNLYDEFIFPDDRKTLPEEFKLVYKRKKSSSEYRIVRKDNNETRYVRLEAELTKNKVNNKTLLRGTLLDITEQKQAQFNNRMLSEAIRHALNGFLMIDENSRITYVNQAMLVMCGYDDAGELLGRDPDILFAVPEQARHIKTELDRTGECVREIKGKRKDGTYLDALVYYSKQKSPDGRDIYYGTAIDITLKKEDEKALAWSGVILNATSDAILTMKVNGKIRFWNRGAQRIFGYSQEEAAGEHFSLIYKQYDRDLVTSTMAKLKDGDDVTEVETKAITRNGREIDVLLSLSAIRDHEGDVDEIVLVAKDVSQSAEATRALEESENRYKDLVEKSGVAIVVDDNEGKIIFFNKDFAKLFGYSTKEIRSKAREELIHPDSLHKVIDYHGSRMEGETRPEQYQVKGIRKDSSEFWLEVKTTTLKDEGKIVGTRNYMWDITERKEVERRLKQSNEEITRLSRHVVAIREEEQRSISSDLHDDLGQLLTALKMDVSWIRSNVPVHEKKIRYRAESAVTITDQAMSAIREIASRLRSPVIDNLGLNEAIEELVSTFQERTELHIDLQLPEKKLEISREMATSVYRIIQESLTNILRHAGGSEAKVKLNHQEEGLEIIVGDNGVGIDMLHLDSHKSFGIISMRERVLQHNGTFRIAPGKEGGTRIDVKLPIGRGREKNRE